MSVYNDEKYLSECIDSIINQTFKNFHFIIIDDASTDMSKQIITDYVKKDKRINPFYNKTNMGLTKNLNFAINKARGNWIVRQDSDDISLNNRLKKAYALIQKNNFDFYSTPAKLIGNKYNKIIPNFFSRTFFNINFLEFKNCLIHGTLIIKSSVISKIKYDESYKYSQDFKLYHDLKNNGYKLYYDRKSITYLLRIHDNQVSKANSKEQLDNFNNILILNGFQKQDKSNKLKLKNKFLEIKIVINDFIRRSLYS